MRAALALGLVAAASCQQVLGLHDLDRDAAPPPASDSALDTPAPADGAALDTDGDGVPDARDNCPTVANASQRDFDADGIGDACDKCPYVADGSDPDSDGDGVGDACDPRPLTAGDRRVLWEDFDDASILSGSNAWTAGSGTWSISNHQLHQTDITVPYGAIGPPITLAQPYLVASYEIDALGAGSGIVYPSGGVADGSNNGSAGYVCKAFYVASAGTNYVIAADGVNPIQLEQWPGQFAVGQTIQIREALGSADACAVAQGSATGSASIAATPASGRVVLTAQVAQVSFDYLFVVDTGSGS